ncbi:MAG: trypsin-like peptidase domain-containing protein [Clostridia bacterium]|nr:trypsin-like peptidase domain-containing protein [Clostridia bacterium]
MKNKRLIALLLIIISALFLFVACDEGTDTPAQATKYTITFVADGTTVSSIKTAGLEKITIPKAPNKDGFEFVKWATADGREITANSYLNASLTENLTVNAIYEPRKELKPTEIYTSVNPSVVFILSVGERSISSGTGFFIDNVGTIVTNYHVIDEADSVQIRLHDGTVKSATKILRYDSDRDLAVLSTEATNTTPVKFGDSDKVVVGETVYAIGYPQAFDLGFSNSTFTSGMVSMLRNYEGYDYIQSTVEITHGNSGGVLINVYGDVIGVTSSGFSIDGVDYMNLSIPVNEIDEVPIYLVYKVADEVLNAEKFFLGDTPEEFVPETRVGYTFDGWYTDKEKTNKYEFGNEISENTTLYGFYTPITYNISLDPNGGSVTPQSLNVTYGSSFALPTPTTTQDCLKFDGWYVGTKKLEGGIWNEAQSPIAVAKWEVSHTTDSAVEENLVEPTCTKNGSYDSVVYCSVCDAEISRINNVIPAKHNFVEGNCTECGVACPYTRDGNYIYFGEYPQTIKAAGVIVTSTTDSRGYYLGSDGCYYAKVTASPCGSGYTFSTGATVTSGTVYYFKVESIRWRILSENGESAFILCDSIIANKAYDSSSNNYKDSDIRAWLNATFYETAFSELQREIILTTTVDNSAASTGNSSNPYVCQDTEDKIYLLSYKEVTNSTYGFSSSFIDRDTARRMSTSDYSRATGAGMNTGSSCYGNGYWWLRSPSNIDSYARDIIIDGYVSFDSVGYSGRGVVPALRIRL